MHMYLRVNTFACIYTSSYMCKYKLHMYLKGIFAFTLWIYIFSHWLLFMLILIDQLEVWNQLLLSGVSL